MKFVFQCLSRLSICIVYPRWADTKDINITVLNVKSLRGTSLVVGIVLRCRRPVPTSHVSEYLDTVVLDSKTPFRNFVTVGCAPNVIPLTGISIQHRADRALRIHSTVADTLIVQLN